MSHFYELNLHPYQLGSIHGRIKRIEQILGDLLLLHLTSLEGRRYILPIQTSTYQPHTETKRE